MQSDMLSTKWNEVKGTVRERWPKLTTDDITKISGQRPQLVSTLKDRYSWTTERAEQAVNEFERSFVEEHVGSGTR